MKKLDLKVWFICNNQCLFCIQWDKRKKFWQRKTQFLKKIIKENYNEWLKYIVFTWWEPTLHPDILEIIKYAQKVWYKQLQLQCNWRTLSDFEYIKKLADAGINEFGPSLHWFKKTTHDQLVGAKNARKETVKWIRNIKKLWYRVITNTVITKQNYKELPKLAYLFIGLWVDQFQFAFPHIWGSAWENRNNIVPKKSKCIKYIHQALDIWKRNWKTCMTEAIPFCFMQWYEWHIAEKVFTRDVKIFDAEKITKSYNKYKKNKGKKHWPPCKKCKLEDICEWPWKEYPQIFGWDEFQSIK